MELPIELRNLIENELNKNSVKDLQKHAENISYRYRNESGNGKRLLTEDIEALSYAAVRMPATYGTVYTSLENTLDVFYCKMDSLLDVGAGTGAGTWAVNELITLKSVTCLERENAMINIGQTLMHNSEDDVLKNSVWKKCDLINSEINERADLVICSYVLNEMSANDRENVLNKLWNATNKILLIVEPGTPVGFNEIKVIRKDLMELGGNIIAPCPNVENCPISENDWCHCTCRVSRTKVHKLLKSGDVPYEDEKFSYIAVCKTDDSLAKNDNCARVLRHPIIESGKITLKLCTKDGIFEKVVTKKDKELFKIARKLNCGDLVDYM